ncbi:M23 family metallopeptidase [Chelativorans sp. AA-79]|uniref:M23 family metallopeptidase n=1 Tax=Chelativorans sp. AA-79 TaxID=3028735 RepID=UPI0023F6BA7C|nr:M23 family metallopeptidase [Chelativorans sp. AA-79]WEX10863.1 M23 family metallopeptidase [Chelativorans sp. AA-79]
MHEIDASFRQKKDALLARRRKRRWRRAAAAAGLAVAGALAAGVYLTRDHWSIRFYEDEVVTITPEAEMLPEDAAVYVPAIVDLPGDPMIISLGDGSQAPKVKAVPRPPDLSDAGISERVEILSDVMISSSERFMTTIPSSQEDFAFFQSQRMAAITPAAAPLSPVQPEAPAAAGIGADQGAGWGETIAEGEAALPAFEKTEIENTTSISFVTPETERFQASEDIFVRVLTARTLESVVLEHRFGAEEARLAGEALKAFFSRDTLEPGFVVALRGFRGKRGAPLVLMQVSVYADETYVGSLARGADGSFVSGTDPWVREDLFHYSGEIDENAPKRQYRLLDAIYSTAARNQVPTGVIGEAIMYLSRGHDLNAFATESDRFVLVYSGTPRGADGASGRVLYVAVRGAEKSFECFVYSEGGGDFACVSGDDRVHSISVVNGMVTPVNGVLTSTFGPRKHPILKTVRIHKGVDWTAPVGTPVFAAFDGEVAFAGEAGEYGNLVRISHPGGRETRYAHLERFAPAARSGTAVKTGDVVGYVGTTGLSTGPHLHFELYSGGNAVDPLGTVTVASDGSAVEALTDRIIRVESGGDAAAKNPLSTATGLGQFIESTWLRMMRTYRPDLARSLSTADLLALRFDPTISREMVRNLAREGEAYLRARGHQITAGRLYLCHFLGMEGAHIVLSAPAGAALAEVLGQGVISANPFLSGKDANWVIGWAENKMRGTRGRAPAASATTVQKVAQASPEFLRYKQALAALVNAAAEAL